MNSSLKVLKSYFSLYKDGDSKMHSFDMVSVSPVLIRPVSLFRNNLLARVPSPHLLWVKSCKLLPPPSWVWALVMEEGWKGVGEGLRKHHQTLHKYKTNNRKTQFIIIAFS